jgi:hypothetical protein
MMAEIGSKVTRKEKKEKPFENRRYLRVYTFNPTPSLA